MNILSFLNIIVFLVYSCLLVFILWKDSKSLLNRVCAALLACFAICSFGSIFINNPSASKDTVRLFDNIGSVGWIGFASFSLWFLLIFTEKKKILKTILGDKTKKISLEPLLKKTLDNKVIAEGLKETYNYVDNSMFSEETKEQISCYLLNKY